MTDRLIQSEREAKRLRAPLLVMLSMAVLGAVAVLAIFGRRLAPQNPRAQDLQVGVSSPGSEHWLGTDDLGRDIFSRLIDGAGPALLGPACVALGTTAIGVALGLVAAYYSGRVDALISRTADLLYALPSLLIAIVVVGLVSGSYWLTVAVLIVLMFPSAVRVCRSATLAQAHLPYVDAARTLGLPDRVVMARHILPNIAPTVMATMLLDFVAALVGFSSLAFLGLGVEPGGSAWGTILSDGQKLIFTNPAMSIAPALLLVLVAASTTIAGDWLYDQRSMRGVDR